MALDRPWRPTLRCVQCGRVRAIDALRAWLAQPVTLDGGTHHFVCQRCRPPELARAWRARDQSRRVDRRRGGP